MKRLLLIVVAFVALFLCNEAKALTNTNSLQVYFVTTDGTNWYQLTNYFSFTNSYPTFRTNVVMTGTNIIYFPNVNENPFPAQPFIDTHFPFNPKIDFDGNIPGDYLQFKAFAGVDCQSCGPLSGYQPYLYGIFLYTNTWHYIPIAERWPE